MIHAAARGEPYACFVRPDTTIPFMAMPDAVDALLALGARAARAADAHRVQRRARSTRRRPRSATSCVARVSGARRSPTRSTRSGRGSSIRGRPTSTIPPRAPTGASIPRYDFERAFSEYLIPTHPASGISAWTDPCADRSPARDTRRTASCARDFTTEYHASKIDRPHGFVTAFAPATVSNVACGFDVLGFALAAPGDEVTARLTASGVTHRRHHRRRAAGCRARRRATPPASRRRRC